MQSLSVVIVCKNEAAIISRTLESLQGLTDDIIVYDNGSTDKTVEISRQSGAVVHQGPWEGFGKTKRTATGLAKYDWVLSLDADEAIDDELKHALLGLKLDDEKKVYEFRFRNFMGNKCLRYGEWGDDKHVRLFHRGVVKWDDAPVHEELVIPPKSIVSRLPGNILHRTVNNMNEYAFKMAHYAMLNAAKYHQQGKKSSWFRIRLAPGFTFLKYYIFKLGFLDGEAGYISARMTAYYTFLKYIRLRELNRNSVRN